jgi:hypothetical protein
MKPLGSGYNHGLFYGFTHNHHATRQKNGFGILGKGFVGRKPVHRSKQSDWAIPEVAHVLATALCCGGEMFFTSKQGSDEI